jgi:hypothetical protein
MTNILHVFQVNFIRDRALMGVNLSHIYMAIRTRVHRGHVYRYQLLVYA